MAKAKAKETEGLLERVVVGPKPLHHIHHETGVRYIAQIGETVWLKPHQAKSKARYLQAPAVAAAQAEASKAEAAEAVAEATEETPAPAPVVEAGGDSAES